MNLDIKHNYIDVGEGKPIVLVHGNGDDISFFVHQIAVLKKIRRVIALDTRGHGKSPRGEGDFTIRRFGDDLYEFMKSLNIEKADILGFSDGANIAMSFAVKHPEMIDRLILSGGNLHTGGIKRWIQLPIEAAYRLLRFGAAHNPKLKLKAEIMSLMINQPNITDDELKKITCPTLVTAGTFDMVKASHTREIASKISGAKLRFIKGTHTVAKRRLQAYNKVILNFLRNSNDNRRR